MVSFDNTETAFSGRSDADLNRARLIFKLIGIPFLLRIGKPIAFFAAKFGGVFRYLIRKTLFNQFCGGENLGDCDSVILKLAESKIKTILDYSSEAAIAEEKFERNFDEIIATQKKAFSDSRIPFNVFKPTSLISSNILEKAGSGKELSLSEKNEIGNFKNKMEIIFKNAFDVGKGVMVDAEESWIQPLVDDIVLDGMRKYNKKKVFVYNTIQMYRHDRMDYLKALYKMAEEEDFLLGIKLVRGAYTEKERNYASENKLPCVIQPNKKATDEAYNMALNFIIERIDQSALCAGTHNEESCLLVVDLMRKHNLPINHEGIYFSQLYGMSDHISFNLSHYGYNVVKYVPYGPVKEVIPYLIRRAEENTSIAGQSGRELSLLTKEIKRRKSDKRYSNLDKHNFP